MKSFTETVRSGLEGIAFVDCSTFCAVFGGCKCCCDHRRKDIYKSKVLEDITSNRASDDIYYIVRVQGPPLVRRRDHRDLLQDVLNNNNDKCCFCMTFWINLLIGLRCRLRLSLHVASATTAGAENFVLYDQLLWPDPSEPAEMGHSCTLPLINFHIHHPIDFSVSGSSGGKLCIELCFDDSDSDSFPSSDGLSGRSGRSDGSENTEKIFVPLPNSIFEGAVDLESITGNKATSLRIHDIDAKGTLLIDKKEDDYHNHQKTTATIITFNRITLSYRVMVEYLFLYKERSAQPEQYITK